MPAAKAATAFTPPRQAAQAARQAVSTWNRRRQAARRATRRQAARLPEPGRANGSRNPNVCRCAAAVSGAICFGDVRRVGVRRMGVYDGVVWLELLRRRVWRDMSL